MLFLLFSETSEKKRNFQMTRKHLVTLMLGTLCLGIANLGVMPILNPIARSLSVSVNEAGQLVTAYAAGVVTGIVLLLVLRNVNLKTILLLDALFIALGNGPGPTHEL